VETVPRNSSFLTMAERRRFGRRPKIALSVDRDCEELENVKVFSSTPSDRSGLRIPPSGSSLRRENGGTRANAIEE
jgi:hypothetical protein